VQFGFFLTKEQKGAYLDGAVTLFGALTLGVYIKLGIGSIDFELVLQLMEDLNLHLKMHASVPIPALSITDPQSSVNSLTSFDPTAASFSVSGSVNLNGLKTLLVNFVRDCLPTWTARWSTLRRRSTRPRRCTTTSSKLGRRLIRPC